MTSYENHVFILKCSTTISYNGSVQDDLYYLVYKGAEWRRTMWNVWKSHLSKLVTTYITKLLTNSLYNFTTSLSFYVIQTLKFCDIEDYKAIIYLESIP